MPTPEVTASCTAHWELWSSTRHGGHVPDAAPSQAYDMRSSGGLARVEDGWVLFSPSWRMDDKPGMGVQCRRSPQ